jgi:hypothetical protein
MAGLREVFGEVAMDAQLEMVGINHRLRKLKDQANARLTSELGVHYRKKRPADIEPVFANIKHNKNFKLAA